MRNEYGFSVVEVILAAALFVIISAGAVGVVLQGLQGNLTGKEQTVASQYATEGLEAMRSIRNQDFAALTNTSSAGIAKSSGVWAITGSNNVFDQYTRVIKVEDVQRDGSGNIVAAGGTIDTRTKKVTSTVSWNVTGSRNNSVEHSIYLTDWKKSIGGNWNNPSEQSGLDLSGNTDANRIAISGTNAYVTRASGNPGFYVINIATPATPTETTTLNLNGSPTAIAISGNYAYVSSTDNSREIQIVNISNPVSPSVFGTFNASGNTDGIDIAVSGNFAYLARNGQLLIVNVSNPASPTLSGTLALNGNPSSIYLNGNYAYIASSDNNQELQIVNVSNPASPSLAGTLDLSGNTDATAISGNGTTIYLGRADNNFYVLNASNPASPTSSGSIAVGGSVNEISVDSANNRAFISLAISTDNFRVIDVATSATPTIFGSFTVSASGLAALSYDLTSDRIYGVSALNNEEFVVIQPN